MRNIAEEKPALHETTFFAGDMENFPVPNEPIDTIASNLVFHHFLFLCGQMVKDQI
jgi:putative AdoMet-dependent methyltransferase